MRIKYSTLFISTVLLAISATAEAREVVDTMGRTVDIPDHPERVVVMSEPAIAVPMIELGVNPIGSFGRADDGTYQVGADFIDTLFGPNQKKPQGIGNNRQVDLEKLYSMKPDLIIGIEFDIDKIKQLSTVAPVYMQHYTTGHLDNFAIEENLAKLFGKETTFQSLKQQYLEDVQETKKQLPESLENKTYLPVIIMDQINIVGEGIGVSQPLNDLGMKSFEVSNDKTHSDGSPKIVLPISAETFGSLNPDILVVIINWGAPDKSIEATNEALNKLVPGWATYMKPAREGRVIYLDGSKVFTPSFLSARYTLGEVRKWAKTK
ncbi:ABC transporter substrate-binding protein [Bartonella apihabitans]|uniref:ABC transporter substrate-binding protein n=1 Tax=uncultured Bartonella sp. TaxID=104108 RepID=UPI0025D25440|nr:ABC transporter substrate-binding protein [Bartonella apihabitans]WLT09474.1 ABC transporter substrate-binding protein [Bartonella apihabitans]